MRTNAEFVSRIVNNLKATTKDGRANRRHILAIGQDKARFLMSQKLDELTMFREEGIISYVPCFELEEEPIVRCDFIDLRICKTMMKSKHKLPEGLFGKTGAGIIEVSSLDGDERFVHTTPTTLRNLSNLKYKRNTTKNYLIRDNYLYLPNSSVEAVNLTMFVIEPYKTKDVSACCEEEEKCKSNWDYTFICPDRFLDLVIRDTLAEMANIYRTSVEDSNPNLDVNSKGKDTQ